MDPITELCGLLGEEKALFDEYEQATLALLDCGPDDAEQYITRRGDMANAIDALAERMGRLCDGLPGGETLMKAAMGRIEFGLVPSEYHCVFYGAQAVRSVASRILQSDRQALARLEALREEALENIRLNQNLPKIKKYLTGLTEKPGGESVVRGKA